MTFFALTPRERGHFSGPDWATPDCGVVGEILDWLIWVLLPLVVVACVIEYRSIRKSLGKNTQSSKQNGNNGSR